MTTLCPKCKESAKQEATGLHVVAVMTHKLGLYLPSEGPRTLYYHTLGTILMHSLEMTWAVSKLRKLKYDGVTIMLHIM